MDQEIFEIVRDHGWYAASIEDDTPPFLYTIGLMKTWRHPEFIILGLDRDIAYEIVAALVLEIDNGRSFQISTRVFLEQFDEPLEIEIRPVHPSHHTRYLGFAMGFMRVIGRIGELDAMQVFWPDANGKFPFDSGCDEKVRHLQKRLDIEAFSAQRELNENTPEK